MKRLIHLSNGAITISVEASTGLYTFPDYEPVFTLSKNKDGAFQLLISPAISGRYDISSDSPVVESAKSIISSITKKENTEMHKLLNQFVNCKAILIPCSFECNQDGSLLNSKDSMLHEEMKEAPVKGV
jgi:hypothetical protein